MVKCSERVESNIRGLLLMPRSSDWSSRRQVMDFSEAWSSMYRCQREFRNTITKSLLKSIELEASFSSEMRPVDEGHPVYFLQLRLSLSVLRFACDSNWDAGLKLPEHQFFRSEIFSERISALLLKSISEMLLDRTARMRFT